ncbi:hypothetical protein C0995_003540 [Termitomyces sp. Mi166|nr:hypothetical protein C0995_003540 [Termitomyces sp. Mi166\
MVIWSAPAFCAFLLTILSSALRGLASSLVTNTSAEVTPGPSAGLETNSTLERRNIGPLERTNYLNAVQCLQNRPSKSGIRGARTRFDDFQGLHISLATQVHQVGQFLPWHRWLLYVYDVALRNECNYKGSIPSRADDFTDIGIGQKTRTRPIPERKFHLRYHENTHTLTPRFSFLSSPVFNANGGFGNLPLVRSPIPNGVFARYRLAFGTGPPQNITDHFIERGFNASMLPYLTQRAVKNTLDMPTFETFRTELEGRPFTRDPKTHDAGHEVIGGDMGDVYSSPGDPLFYSHHANLDRLWWIWQNVDPGNRLYQISGRSTTNPPYRSVTLDTTLPTGTLGRPVKIREMMDIKNDLLCYTYI